MDVQFSPEEIAFRQEVRTFLENEYPAELRGKYSRDEYSKEDFLLWQRTLFKRGWGPLPGRRNMAAPAGTRPSATSSRKNAPALKRSPSRPSAWPCSRRC